MTFFVLYALMLLLWLFGYEMTKGLQIMNSVNNKFLVTPSTKVESLNSFECPADGSIRNQYDCSRFDLEVSHVKNAIIKIWPLEKSPLRLFFWRWRL